MNKYQLLFENGVPSNASIANEIKSASSWEDIYWLAKIALSYHSEVSDQQIMELLEDCFFMGLSSSHRDAFFDANEKLAKLYIRYGKYDEAASRLIVLASNYDCPDWVHLYLAMTQLHSSTSKRIVEDPHLFFARLLTADIKNDKTKDEIRSIFAKYLYMIIEQYADDPSVASTEIVQFAEKIRATDTAEFRLFHETICPYLNYRVFKDDNGAAIVAVETDLSRENAELMHQLEKAQNESKSKDGLLKSAQEETAAIQEKLKKEQKEKRTTQKELEQEKNGHEHTKKQLYEEQQKQIETESALKESKEREAKLEAEKTTMMDRLNKLEQMHYTQVSPESIDGVFLQMSTWLNVTVRRYFAQWLTSSLSNFCHDNFWNQCVWPALHSKEKEKFNTYNELSDFAIDALLNIYYYNLDLFYSYPCAAKTNDKDRIKEMQRIRNRWVGHFEEKYWTKERILFDLDTLIQFIAQIKMPKDKQKEFRDFRNVIASAN